MGATELRLRQTPGGHHAGADCEAKSESCSISCVRTQYGRTTLSLRRFSNRLIYLQLRTRLGKEKRPPENSGGLYQIVAPHSGQSSQLLFEATDGNAQLLSTVARSALIRQGYLRFAQAGDPLGIAHSGQSSQLVFDTNERNAVSPNVVRSELVQPVDRLAMNLQTL